MSNNAGCGSASGGRMDGAWRRARGCRSMPVDAGRRRSMPADVPAPGTGRRRPRHSPRPPTIPGPPAAVTGAFGVAATPGSDRSGRSAAGASKRGFRSGIGAGRGGAARAVPAAVADLDRALESPLFPALWSRHAERGSPSAEPSARRAAPGPPRTTLLSHRLIGAIVRIVTIRERRRHRPGGIPGRRAAMGPARAPHRSSTP